MAKVLHSAPRYASFDGVIDALTARLGDALIAIREEYGELVLNVARDSVEATLRTLRTLCCPLPAADRPASTAPCACV